MLFTQYIDALKDILGRIQREQGEAIGRAGQLIADALRAGGVVHAFGSGHSHMMAEEAFYRAGGIVPVNPILDERLIFLHGAIESTEAERASGYAAEVLAKEDVRRGDAAILVSNSGRNAAPIEMAIELKARGVPTIAITNLEQSRAAASRHASGKRLFELVDVAVDNCVPPGDAVMTLPGPALRMAPASTVAGAAIVNSIMLEAAESLLRSGGTVPLLPSANAGDDSDRMIEEMLGQYSGRIRYFRKGGGADSPAAG